MEFKISFSILVIIVTIFFLMNLLNTIKKRNSNPKFPPPGPWKIPVFGNIFSMVSRQPPPIVLRNLARKHGPLMHLQLGEISALIVSSPQMAKEIMVNNDLAFSSRPEILAGKMVLYNNSDIGFSPHWRQLRKICTLELLSAKKVRSFSYIREEEVKFLIESIMLLPGSPINLAVKINMLTNTITSKAAFGKIPKDQDLLIQMLQGFIDVSGGFHVAELFPSLKFLPIITGMNSKIAKIHQNLDKILNNIIAEHKKHKKSTKWVKEDTDKEDLLDILFRRKDIGDLEFSLSIDNIKAVIIDIFIAGTDTCSTTVEWAMSEILRNPEVFVKVQSEVRENFERNTPVQETDFQELKYLKMVIKETLRLHPPVPLLLPRECRESCVINGYVIPVKTKVIVNAWALGRDTEYWHDANRFIPERFENTSIDFSGKNLEYIPFGAGRRMCPGILFGVANVEIILSHLLYHFDWKLPGGMKPEDLDMSETFGASCRKKNNLYLIATPYTPLHVKSQVALAFGLDF